MAGENNTIQLTTQPFITHCPNSVRPTDQDAYIVRDGEVLIFIAKWQKRENKQGKAIFVGEAKKGDVFPAFSYRDEERIEWRFVVKAKSSSAELTILPHCVTSVLRANFAKRYNLTDFDREGFENSLVERYITEELKADVLRDREIIIDGKCSDMICDLIVRPFESNNSLQIDENDPAMKAVRCAATLMKSEAIDFEKVRQKCREQFDIPTIANAANLICREVVLEPKWFRGDCGVLIGKIDKKYVVCVPKGFGYSVYDIETDKMQKLDAAMAEKIEPKAYSIERALPGKSLQLKDLFRFGLKDMGKLDVVSILVLGLVTTLIGILLPELNQKIYDDYIPMGSQSELVQLCMVIGAFMIGNLFFSMVKSIAEFRLQSRVGYRIQDAAYHRVFRLPESFFHSIDSADLAQRIMSIGGIINSYVSSIVITGVSTVFSLLYLIRMFKSGAKLAWVSLLMLTIYFVILVVFSFLTLRFQKEEAEKQGVASSKLYQYLSGIAKIRMAGAEDRAIHDYMVPFSGIQSLEIRENRYSTFSSVLSISSSVVFSMVLYILVKDILKDPAKSNITMGAFMGFNTAFGAFSGSVEQLVQKGLSFYQMKPTVERFKPIFETACEDEEDAEFPGELNGDINVNHVSFSYAKGDKQVLDNINMNIKSGEYIGIVGSSGCGKSTLLKLLLGFEKPTSGEILYDGRSILKLNKYALRQKLGVVLQNGQLIAGSIYENIVITAPKATAKDVQAVIEKVGLKEDIAQMPMGIHTMLSENSGTISGGQKQRILIARAIISNPKILIFDEATSALDNITQATVSDSLDRMNVTRIVVAHRLSTIKNCDRIFVMDQGRIVEEGKYDDLMKKHGLFYELAVRQIAE